MNVMDLDSNTQLHNRTSVRFTNVRMILFVIDIDEWRIDDPDISENLKSELRREIFEFISCFDLEKMFMSAMNLHKTFLMH
jgi:hypothetical protein